ncbi:PrsW family glutamic-type intramembrane protease [Streptomyces sp. NPDC087532]|uniref:PrsW family glutamic-type intramembrane protease n=1 Tax=unclassified Streptomyces TaxID=2593676 RepID=UPI0034239E14
MVVLMGAAAVWGVLQVFAVAWPTRSVRLSTVLLALAVGVYGCGVATALIQLAYTRVYASESGRPLGDVVGSTGYTVAPWEEELVKVSPLLLAGLLSKVRQQWGLTDFVVLGAALGAGFGLLESVLRFGMEADRAIPRPEGGWIIPDSFFPPYVPGPVQVLTTWLPAPFSESSMSVAPTADTFTHLVWTAMAGLGVGLLWRARGWARLMGVLPWAAATAHHAVNNYAAEESTEWATHWLAELDAMAWLAPLVCLALAMALDLRQLRRGRRAVPRVLLSSECRDGDSAGALVRYAAWCLPWSLVIALRYVRLRRSLLYAAAVAPPGSSGVLYQALVRISDRMDATDHQGAWEAGQLRSQVKVARAHVSRRRWLYLLACVLMLPSILFLGIGTFTSTVALQGFFTTDSGSRTLMGFGAAALIWIAWQVTAMLRTWRASSRQPTGEVLAVHRFRLGVAMGSVAAGGLLLYRGLGAAGPDGRAIPTLHLLDALDTFLVLLGFALLLFSLLALFPPGGLALAGGGAVGALTAEALLDAALLGTAGLVLMAAAGADGAGRGTSGGESSSAGTGKHSTDPATSDAVGSARERKVAELTQGKIPSGEPGKPGLRITKPGAGTSDVDVIGGDGSYIAVGGPAKARNLAKFGEKCHILRYAAEQQGVRAQVYLEEGTPEAALNLARRILGDANVHTFVR